MSDKASRLLGESSPAAPPLPARSPVRVEGWENIKAEPIAFVLGEVQHIRQRVEKMVVKNEAFDPDYGLGKIALAGFGLGSIFGLHVCLVLYSIFVGSIFSIAFQWGMYVSMLMVFHFMEFMSIAIIRPYDLKYESFVIDHSKAYTYAVVASFVEFWIEVLLFPSLKRRFLPLLFGTLVCGLGQIIRVASMLTCESNFSHQVQEERSEDHVLVTSGLYSILRHPSYFGWFWWSVSTQVLLSNPICFVGYFYASHQFFNDRIPAEEKLLMKFFPNQYPSYKTRTVIGIPFIEE